MNSDELKAELINKLKVMLPRKNGVVVLTGDKKATDRPAMEEIVFMVERWCMENEIDNVLFVTIPEGFSLTELDEKTMNELGWFKKEHKEHNT